MKNFFSRLKIRIARRRLTKVLDVLTEQQLKLACAFSNWVRANSLVPGDRIVLTFDGEHSDVGVLDRMNDYFKDELFSALKDLEK